MKDIELNEVASLAAEYVNTTQRHIFLTGKAGTGKTTFLHYIAKHSFKNAVITAPTGIAAINAGGVTLHSLLQLPFGAFVPENISFPADTQLRINTPISLGQKSKIRKEKRLLIQQMELLIIDEVSMLRADLLDCIDLRLRSLRRRPNEAFGGVQVLFIGDLMQLPPVVKDNEWEFLKKYYKSPYFFEARALHHQPPLSVELKKIYRQTDQAFIDLLNRLRNNQQTQEDLAFLNQHVQKNIAPEGYIHLTTHNYKADRINRRELENLSGKSRTFEAEVIGDFPENLYPNAYELELKKGAQVMFIKNDPSGEGQFFNGKIGRISHMDGEDLRVRFEDGKEVYLAPYQWDNIKYSLEPATNQIEEKKLGSFSQFPIKLAWAVTVHKSQGLTFEKAILDVGDSFAPGQLYVALSRLTSLDGLVLSSPLPTRPPQISASLLDFVEDFEDIGGLKAQITEDKKGFMKKFALSAFNFDKLQALLEAHIRTFNKDEHRSLKQQYLPWTLALKESFVPLVKVGKGFIKQVYGILEEGNKPQHLAIRATKAQEYFEPNFISSIRKIQGHLRQLAGKKQVKNYREEVEELEAAFIHQLRNMVKFCLLAQETAKGRIPTLDMLRAWEQAKKLRPAPPPKPKKIPTRDITFSFFAKGLSPEEIAERRGLSPGTIKGHLSELVEEGKVGIEEVIDPKKAEKILTEMKKAPDRKLSDLKAYLGEEYDYPDIKFVIAEERRKAREAAR